MISYNPGKLFKGALWGFGEEIQAQNFDMYNLNDKLRNIYLCSSLYKQAVLSGKIRSLEHCLKLERWQGPPLMNKAKQ